MKDSTDALTITPLSDAMGAEATGVDVSDIDEKTFLALRDALHDNIVLVIRDQALDPSRQAAFAARFGEIQYHLNPESRIPDQPEVQILTNEKSPREGMVGNANAGDDWHSDHSYVEVPTAYTMLHAVILPDTGGDTQWTNLVKAYETLPEETRKRLEGVIAIHSFNRMRNPRMPDRNRPDFGPEYYAKRSPPDVFHPLARTHPFTGRKALYMSPRFTIGIKNLPEDEGQALLDELFSHAADPSLTYRHSWRKGDLVMWDNRSTMHIALGGVPEPQVRRMHRSMVKGEIPV